MDNSFPYVRLSTDQPRLRWHEWRLWKKKGYRVLADDGVTFSGLNTALNFPGSY